MGIGLELIGLLLVTSHLVFFGLLVAWFGMGKPTSIAVFRKRLGTAVRRRA